MLPTPLWAPRRVVEVVWRWYSDVAVWCGEVCVTWPTTLQRVLLAGAVSLYLARVRTYVCRTRTCLSTCVHERVCACARALGTCTCVPAPAMLRCHANIVNCERVMMWHTYRHCSAVPLGASRWSAARTAAIAVVPSADVTTPSICAVATTASAIGAVVTVASAAAAIPAVGVIVAAITVVFAVTVVCCPTLASRLPRWPPLPLTPVHPDPRTAPAVSVYGVHDLMESRHPDIPFPVDTFGFEPVGA